MSRTDEQRLAHELFASYMRGWKDGCTAHAKRKEFTEHATRPDLAAEYESGYADGFLLRTTTQRKAAKRIGYVPNILRTQDAP